MVLLLNRYGIGMPAEYMDIFDFAVEVSRLVGLAHPYLPVEGNNGLVVHGCTLFRE